MVVLAGRVYQSKKNVVTSVIKPVIHNFIFVFFFFFFEFLQIAIKKELTEWN